MLVLGRKPQESIIINGNIKVTVLRADGRQIRIGIEAPKEIAVHREEIFKLIQRQKIQQKKPHSKSLKEDEDAVEFC